jgi:hypothetical protein
MTTTGNRGSLTSKGGERHEAKLAHKLGRRVGAGVEGIRSIVVKVDITKTGICDIAPPTHMVCIAERTSFSLARKECSVQQWHCAAMAVGSDGSVQVHTPLGVRFTAEQAIGGRGVDIGHARVD